MHTDKGHLEMEITKINFGLINYSNEILEYLGIFHNEICIHRNKGNQ